MQRVQICLNGRSCAALDACISPYHDVTIQNPPNALINVQSVVLQLRQPGGTLDVIGESLMPIGQMPLTNVQLDQPKWLRFLPADANDLWREDFLEPAPKASNAFGAGMVHKHSARKLRQVKCANIE